MTSETVSVVIPCYNGARFLRETLESALNQTHAPLEIIVVDDGSTDESASIAESLGDPVRVIRQTNQGESVARNRGIEEARGDWIAFLDADDCWLPTKLERQLAAVTDDIAFVCSSHYPVSPEHWRIGDMDVAGVRPVTILEGNFQLPSIMREGAPCLVQSVLVRRSNPARFPTWTPYGEDTLYLLELSYQTTFAIIREPQLLYRIAHGGQASRPDMACRWHESMAQWLVRNPLGLSNEIIATCKLENDRRLLFTATNRRRCLDNIRFLAIREYCDTLSDFAFRVELGRIARRPGLYYRCANIYHRFKKTLLPNGRLSPRLWSW